MPVQGVLDEMESAGRDARAYDEGAAAFHEGAHENHSPYAHGTEEHRQWLDGFLAAEEGELA